MHRRINKGCKSAKRKWPPVCAYAQIVIKGNKEYRVFMEPFHCLVYRAGNGCRIGMRYKSSVKQTSSQDDNDIGNKPQNHEGSRQTQWGKIPVQPGLLG